MENSHLDESSESPTRNRDEPFLNTITDTENSQVIEGKRIESIPKVLCDDPTQERPLHFLI